MKVLIKYLHCESLGRGRVHLNSIYFLIVLNCEGVDTFDYPINNIYIYHSINEDANKILIFDSLVS